MSEILLAILLVGFIALLAGSVARIVIIKQSRPATILEGWLWIALMLTGGVTFLLSFIALRPDNFVWLLER